MRIIHPEARGSAARWLLQCALATLTILVIFLLLDALLGAPFVALLGASTFIVFAMPKSRSAGPGSLLGGYLVGTFSGTLCSLLARSRLVGPAGVSQSKLLVTFGALSVGLAISIMVFTNTGHPPAAGLALGFVLSPWNYATIILVLSAAGLLSLARWLLRKELIDLA